MPSPTAHIGFLTVELHIPDAQSLKDKRRILLSLKERIKSHHNVSAAEIGEMDKWQLAYLGICMVANEKARVDECLQKILNFMAGVDGVEIVRHSVEFL